MSKKTVVAVGVLILCVAGASNAVTNFSEYPVGTLVSDQYAGQGVVFLPGDITLRLPQISNDGAVATQPVLRPTGEPDYYNFRGDFWMQFNVPTLSVSFDSGYWDSASLADVRVYDSGKNLLANLTNGGTGVQAFNISGLGPIGYVYFNSMADGSGAGIDNLDFSAVPAPGAILLGTLGTGLVGWLRRRRTI